GLGVGGCVDRQGREDRPAAHADQVAAGAGVDGRRLAGRQALHVEAVAAGAAVDHQATGEVGGDQAGAGAGQRAGAQRVDLGGLGALVVGVDVGGAPVAGDGQRSLDVVQRAGGVAHVDRGVAVVAQEGHRGPGPDALHVEDGAAGDGAGGGERGRGGEGGGSGGVVDVQVPV